MNLPVGNDFPGGMDYHGGKLFVTDEREAKVFAYNNDGTRSADDDFAYTGTGNLSGIVFAEQLEAVSHGDRIYIFNHVTSEPTIAEYSYQLLQAPAYIKQRKLNQEILFLSVAYDYTRDDILVLMDYLEGRGTEHTGDDILKYRINMLESDSIRAEGTDDIGFDVENYHRHLLQYPKAFLLIEGDKDVVGTEAEMLIEKQPLGYEHLRYIVPFTLYIFMPTQDVNDFSIHPDEDDLIKRLENIQETVRETIESKDFYNIQLHLWKNSKPTLDEGLEWQGYYDETRYNTDSDLNDPYVANDVIAYQGKLYKALEEVDANVIPKGNSSWEEIVNFLEVYSISPPMKISRAIPATTEQQIRLAVLEVQFYLLYAYDI